MKNSEKPIYPQEYEERAPGAPSYHQKVKHQHLGLTKREYFAGLAMQGLLSNPSFKLSNDMAPEKQYAISALVYADELLKQLEND